MTVRPLLMIAFYTMATAGCAASLSSGASAAAGTPLDGAAPGTSAPADAAQSGPSGPSASPEPSASSPAPGASPASGISPDAFRIGPEDILDVQVWRNAELSRVVPVRPDGMISLPLVNDIRAAGLTAVELRDQVTQRLSEFVPSPEVSVMVREVHSVKVAVVGNVRMPGHYEVNSPATVLELIARAQGLTEFADRGRIVVLRQSGSSTTRIPFNYSRVAEGSEQENFSVRPGDIIVVP